MGMSLFSVIATLEIMVGVLCVRQRL